ncbi:hypothetical protein D7X99_04585 [Corallococcus sp. AB032C]|nr:hypothetical protein D7X99_04585 [Corallococcus sp. AB032C]
MFLSTRAGLLHVRHPRELALRLGLGGTHEPLLACTLPRPFEHPARLDFLGDGKMAPVGSEGHAVAGPGGNIPWHRA